MPGTWWALTACPLMVLTATRSPQPAPACSLRAPLCACGGCQAAPEPWAGRPGPATRGRRWAAGVTGSWTLQGCLVPMAGLAHGLGAGGRKEGGPQGRAPPGARGKPVGRRVVEMPAGSAPIPPRFLPPPATARTPPTGRSPRRLCHEPPASFHPRVEGGPPRSPVIGRARDQPAAMGGAESITPHSPCPAPGLPGLGRGRLR